MRLDTLHFRLAPASRLVAAAAVCALLTAGTSHAQTTPTPDPNAHLSGLSQDELRGLSRALTDAIRHAEDSAACFGAFLEARERAANKQGRNLTPEEQSAAAVTLSPQAWVNDCLRRRGWTSTEAGTTDRFGRVQVHTPEGGARSRPVDRLQQAYDLEQRRATERHEARHAARRAAFARRLGLDPATLVAYADARDKLEAFLANEQTQMSIDDFGQAFADLNDFVFRNGRLASDARYYMPRVQRHLTAAERRLITWGHQNRAALNRIDQQAVDPVDTAREEREDYRQDAAYLRQRLGVVNGRITTPSPPSGTPGETDSRKSPKPTPGTPPKPQQKEEPKTEPNADPRADPKKPAQSEPEKASNRLPDWARSAINDAESKSGPE